MLGDEAFRLAKEARDITPDHIPPYNEEQVRLVTQETRYLWMRIEVMVATLNSTNANSSSQRTPATPSSQPLPLPLTQDTNSNSVLLSDTQQQVENTNSQTALYFLSLNRNKRCLLAYHHRRASFLRSLLWTLHLAPSMVPASVVARLSPDEHSYTREYARLNAKYREAVEEQLCPNDSLDWAADGELPPRDQFIEVRVVRDCGEIVTENGVVNLQTGTQHYLQRSDIEHLITIGYLEHINPN